MDAKEQVISLPPVRFWGLDPLFWTHIKMFVKDVYELHECADYRGVFCYANNHPVIRVEVLGHIVSIDEKEKLTSYGVDDGSGTILCCKWHPAASDLKSTCSGNRELYNLGQLVTVQGKISTFREQRQLTVDFIYAESDPNVEVLFWLEAINLGNNIYSKKSFTNSLKNPPAGIDELTKEEELKRAILQQIKENKIVAFQFRTLCLDPDIQQIASEAVSQKSTDQPQGKKLDRSYEMKKVVRQVIKDLERAGLVYFKDSRTDLYEVISHEHNLGPAIIKAMRKVAAPSGSPVSKWAIMDVLHSSHKFHHVTLHQIEDSLDKLLQGSDIYRHSEHQYCLV
ncbi:unnamed protein product [Porites evermanni]|uniref:CST complex subunit STN1 n=1 Tax=Porites evermanni TaxID=104178 RepID=A0ABN8SBR1_9CNID|nr:unnamed protein product [Porites evermanni]